MPVLVSANISSALGIGVTLPDTDAVVTSLSDCVVRKDYPFEGSFNELDKCATDPCAVRSSTFPSVVVFGAVQTSTTPSTVVDGDVVVIMTITTSVFTVRKSVLQTGVVSSLTLRFEGPAGEISDELRWEIFRPHHVAYPSPVNSSPYVDLVACETVPFLPPATVVTPNTNEVSDLLGWLFRSEDNLPPSDRVSFTTFAGCACLPPDEGEDDDDDDDDPPGPCSDGTYPDLYARINFTNKIGLTIPSTGWFTVDMPFSITCDKVPQNLLDLVEWALSTVLDNVMDNINSTVLQGTRFLSNFRIRTFNNALITISLDEESNPDSDGVFQDFKFVADAITAQVELRCVCDPPDPDPDGRKYPPNNNSQFHYALATTYQNGTTTVSGKAHLNCPSGPCVYEPSQVNDSYSIGPIYNTSQITRVTYPFSSLIDAEFVTGSWLPFGGSLSCGWRWRIDETVATCSARASTETGGIVGTTLRTFGYGATAINDQRTSPCTLVSTPSVSANSSASWSWTSFDLNGSPTGSGGHGGGSPPQPPPPTPPPAPPGTPCVTYNVTVGASLGLKIPFLGRPKPKYTDSSRSPGQSGPTKPDPNDPTNDVVEFFSDLLGMKIPLFEATLFSFCLPDVPDAVIYITNYLIDFISNKIPGLSLGPASIEIGIEKGDPCSCE